MCFKREHILLVFVQGYPLPLVICVCRLQHPLLCLKFVLLSLYWRAMISFLVFLLPMQFLPQSHKARWRNPLTSTQLQIWGYDLAHFQRSVEEVWLKNTNQRGQLHKNELHRHSCHKRSKSHHKHLHCAGAAGYQLLNNQN